MQNIKNPINYSSKLYESSVTEGRFKASSLYQKRSEFTPTNQKNDNYFQASQYKQAPRKYSNGQSYSKLTTSQANNDKFNEILKPKDYLPLEKSFNSLNEAKSARRNTDRNSYNENSNVKFQHQKKRNNQNTFLESNNSLNQKKDDFERIVEKLNKKQKIIQQLQKLCGNTVLDNVKSPKGYQKGTYEVYSPVRTRKQNKNISLAVSNVDSSKQHESTSTPSPFTIQLTNAENFGQKDKLSSSSFLGGQEEKKKERKISEYERIKANPEDISKDSWRKNNLTVYSPKETPSKLKLEEKYDKKSFFNEKTSHDTLKSSQTTKKTIFDTQQVYSPVKTRKSKELAETKEYKYAKDYRHILQTKNIQKSNVFSSKKLSIYDFQVKKQLGQGKFGTVFQAFHRQTKTLYALKKISKKTIKSNLMIDQFLQQVKIQSYCNHENILKLYGFFDDQDHIYLILQYMEEGTLFTHLKVSKTLNQQDVKLKLRDIARAVIYLHEEGIAHRDIKPENIVLSNGVGKLCDFGWATICTDRRKTYCGTFDYVAPEILEGAEYDVTVDLWCLGVLAYQLLVGKAPFYHISRKQTMKKIMNVQKLEYPSTISRDAISFIESLIKKNPQERLNGDNILRHPFLQNINSNPLN